MKLPPLPPHAETFTVSPPEEKTEPAPVFEITRRRRAVQVDPVELSLEPDPVAEPLVDPPTEADALAVRDRQGRDLARFPGCPEALFWLRHFGPTGARVERMRDGAPMCERFYRAKVRD